MAFSFGGKEGKHGKIVLNCRELHGLYEIANNAIIESTEGEYLRSGLKVLEGVCVCLPTVKHIGSSNEFRWDYERFSMMSIVHGYRSLAHFFWIL